VKIDRSQLVGKNGKILTEALFWETNRDREAYAPLFTLKPVEHMGCPSLKQIYLEHRDPTEYTFAMSVFGSWQHWEALTSLIWFKPHVEEWRSELAVLLKSEAARAALGVLSDPEAPSANKMQAARFVAEKGWEEKATKGRPKKEDIQKAARQVAETNSHWDEDYKRIMN
jgi:hypothetical protein